MRDAKNSDEVLSRVRTQTGVDLQALTGVDESRLTFLAVRRWYGWWRRNRQIQAIREELSERR